jgi:hypothetical protein
VSTPAWAGAALADPVFTGLSRQRLAELTAELAGPWTAAHQAALRQRRGHPRRRAAGAGPTTAWAGTVAPAMSEP